MYAIVKTGGKQYRVEAGDTIHVDKLEGGIGDTITLEKHVVERRPPQRDVFHGELGRSECQRHRADQRGSIVGRDLDLVAVALG